MPSKIAWTGREGARGSGMTSEPASTIAVFRSGCRRGRPLFLGLAAGTVGCALLAGCLAQKAELDQVSRDLDKKITTLNQQDKEFAEAIKKEQGQLAQQRKDFENHINEMRARLRQDIRDVKDEELPKFQGKLDELNYKLGKQEAALDDKLVKQADAAAAREAAARKEDREKLLAELTKVSARLDTMTSTIAGMAKTVDARLEQHDKAIAAGEAAAALNHQQVGEQLAALHHSLADFKQALTALGDKLVQEEQRVSELSAGVEAKSKADAVRLGEFQRKLDADARTTSAHLEQVTRSVNSVAKALEGVTGRLVVQVEGHDRQLEELTQAVRSLHKPAAASGSGAAGKKRDKEAGRKAKPREESTAEPNEAATARPDESRGTADSTASSSVSPAEEPGSGRPSESVAVVSAVPTETADKGAESGPQPGELAAAPPSKEQIKADYDAAFQQFKKGDLNRALDGFSDFLVRHPDSELSPNAQFWLGECYYRKKAFEQAVEAFDRVRGLNPKSEKVPASLYRKGLALLELNEPKKASMALTQVVQAFPKSPEAGKAKEKLAQLKQER